MNIAEVVQNAGILPCAALVHERAYTTAAHLVRGTPLCMLSMMTSFHSSPGCGVEL